MKVFRYGFLPVLAILVIPVLSFGQAVDLDYQNTPLNEILLELNVRFEVELSIDAALSEACLVTVSEQYPSLKSAIGALAAYCRLDVLRINGVYTFRMPPQSGPARPPVVRYLFQGEVTEAGSGEPLPFTSISVHGLSLITDTDGRFSFRSPEPVQRLQIRHLGYGVTDTVIDHGNDLEIALTPGEIVLDEVVISASTATVLASSGQHAGQISINDVSTRLVPGNNTNALFNHLRLYPGIMAAGEALSDFIIWGSYPGQNQVVFDGITLFNSYGIYDDLGRVNPLLIKNIEVYKGGYNVDVGDRIGGVILMDGRSGNRNEVDGKISVSSEMANAYISIPLFNKSSTLQLAGRKSYYQALNWNNVLKSGSDDFIVPEYDYGDANLKFTTAFQNSDKLEFSVIFSMDDYGETLERREQARYIRELRVKSMQIGSSMKYLRNWKRGGITTLDFSQSYYDSELNSDIIIRLDVNPALDIDLEDQWENPVSEYRTGLTHAFSAGRRQDLKVALHYIRDKYRFDSETGTSSFNHMSEHVDRLSVFVKDVVTAAEWLKLQFGLKVDVPFPYSRPYVQPRAAAEFAFGDHWRLNAAWGMYNQFVSKTPVVDNEGNRLWVWQTAEDEQVPVPSSMHHVLGLAYLSQHFDLNIEGYYRSTEGLSRYLSSRTSDEGILREGEGRAYGMDVFAKGRFREHALWASYSLAWAQEKYFAPADYHDAPQSQRHEFKTALVLNFKPVRISLTNVYGTGFPNTTFRDDELQYVKYNRLDLAFQYAVTVNWARLETGFSILNLLNRENIRLNQFVRFPDGTTASTSGIPFTPSVYFNFGF